MGLEKDEAKLAAMRERLQRIREEAETVPEEEVVGFLTSGGRQIADYFLLGESLFAALVCYWQNGNLMAQIIEDTTRWLAVKLFLLRQGTRIFKNHEELQQTARQENWPGA